MEEKNKIVFKSSFNISTEIVPLPKPAKFYMPDWYKKIKPVHNMNEYDNNLNCTQPPTVKSCMPVLDSFTSGYIQETWCDIYAKMTPTGQIILESLSDFKITSFRNRKEDLENRIKISKDYYDAEFLWQSPWFPKTPIGWSILIVHPLNHMELPFVSFSGVVESDLYYQSGNIPFLLKKGFTGLIPKGTPMYQFIPVKRSTWESEFEETPEATVCEVNHTHKDGWYKDKFWKKKIFL